MKVSRVVGILLVIAGVACLFFASYIKGQIGEGNAQIAKGQSAVSQGNKLFSQNALTQQIGKSVTGPIQKKINEGKATIAHYENVAHALQIGGIAGIVIGAGMIIYSCSCKGKRRS